MSAGLRVTLGQASLAGAHDINQDFHGALLPEGHLLASKGIVLAIADGISTSRVSQLASQTAVGSFLDDYYATSEAWSVHTWPRSFSKRASLAWFWACSHELAASRRISAMCAPSAR